MDRNKLILGLANFLLRNLCRSKHRITIIRLSLGAIGPVVEEIWVGPPHPESEFYQVLGDMNLVNVEIERF